MSETTSLVAKTIHRLLEFDPAAHAFKRNGRQRSNAVPSSQLVAPGGRRPFLGRTPVRVQQAITSVNDDPLDRHAFFPIMTGTILYSLTYSHGPRHPNDSQRP